VDRVKQYALDVEAAGRVADRHGLTHKPQTDVEVGMLIVGQLATLNRNIEGFMDMFRSDVSSTTSRIPHAPRTHTDRFP
jgi:hypothetical protein